MQIKTFYFNPIRVCTYVIYDVTAHKAILIDTGCYDDNERERLLEFCTVNALTPVAHLLTHAHLDHIFGAQFVYEQWGLLPYLNPQDAPLFQHLPLQAQFFGIPFSDKTLDRYIPISNKQQLDFGFLTVDTIATPGHTEGGVCYLITDKADTKQYLFTGDTLFCGGMGRTDLPGGDYSTLIHSIKDILFCLDDNMVVYPGHGLPTSIGQEKQFQRLYL